MASTTSQLVARIRVKGRDSETGQRFTDAQIIQNALNPSARKVVAATLADSGNDTIAIVSGTSSYAIPSTLIPLVRFSSVIFGTDKRPLTWVDQSEIAKLTGTGEPDFYTIFNNQFLVGPVPNVNGTVTIDAYAGPTAAAEVTPATTSDELNLPTDVEDVIVTDAARELCEILNETTRAQNYEVAVIRGINALRSKMSPAARVAESIPNGYDDRLNFY